MPGGSQRHGKDHLFRVITSAAVPDEGELWRTETLRIGHLEQEVPPDTDQTIFEVVAGGLGEIGALLSEYHQVTHEAGLADHGSLQRLAQLQSRIEAFGGWNVHQKVETILTRFGLPEDKRLADCSGGTRRQIMLAPRVGERAGSAPARRTDQSSRHQCDHLAGEYLLNYPGAVMFITHDRSFRAPSGNAHRRARPRSTDLVSGRL